MRTHWMTIGGAPCRRITPWLLLVALLVVGGCGSIEKDKMAVALQRATFGYEAALRWGPVSNAVGYLAPEKQRTFSLPAHWQDLRLTGYDLIRPPVVDREAKTATQMVAMEYLHTNRQVVKQLVDRQIWEWDEDQGRWWLTSGLPSFD